MAAVSKEEYLKKYLSVNAEEKQKKKRRKVHGQIAKVPRSRIVDDDVDLKSLLPNNLANSLDEDVGDNDPTVAEFIDERPDDVKQLEKFRASNAWKILGQDGNAPDTDSRKKQRHDSDSDQSPARIQRHDSDSDQSPVRKQRHNSDSDQSPVRRQRHDSDSDQSPPRKRDKIKADTSEKRVRKSRFSDIEKIDLSRNSQSNSGSFHGADQSPPRRQRHDSDSDQSPPRKSKPDSKQPYPRQSKRSNVLPPRRRRQGSDSDQSPPRRRNQGADSDQSPPRRQRQGADSDQSPPRRRNQGADSDQSPPRRRRQGLDSDQSPPRRRRQGADSDQSPPKRRRQASDSDQSPPRRRRQGADSDQSPPRRRRQASNSDQSPPRRGKHDSIKKKSDDKMEKTLGGKKAGLSSAKQMRLEADELKMKEEENFRQISDDRLGRGAATVFRDKSGKRRNLQEERRKESEEAKKKEKEDEKFKTWGKGLKQIEEKSKQLEDALHEVNKPLARYKDDEDLDQMLRDMDRAEDPMLAFIKKKKKSSAPVKEKPKYKGPAPPPNRFGIAPGYRWDGVDRSNGFEKQIFTKQAEKSATAAMAYKWSVEDM